SRVTGVQTCALPLLAPAAISRKLAYLRVRSRVPLSELAGYRRRSYVHVLLMNSRLHRLWNIRVSIGLVVGPNRESRFRRYKERRSEERSVGIGASVR